MGRKTLIVALLLAAALQIIIAVRSPTISKDGIVFIDTAKGLASTPAETMRAADQHPGYPAMILAGRRIAGLFPGAKGNLPWLISAQVFSGLSGLAAIVLVWLIARRLFDTRIAGVAAILFAVLPDFRRNAMDAFADMPHLAFYLAAAWTAIEGFSSEKPRWFIASGVLSALAYWTRPEGITVALVIGGVLAVMAIRPRGESRRFALLSLAAVVICAGVVAAPYPLIKGKLTSKKDLGELMHSETWSPSADVQAPVAQPDQNHEQATPRRSPWCGATERAYDLSKELFGAFVHALRYFLVLPLLIGLIYRKRAAGAPHDEASKPVASALPIALLVACHTMLLFALYFIANYISVRHTMPIAALAMPWIALGWVLCVEWLCRFAKQVRPAHAVNAFLVLFVILMFLRGIRPIHTQRLAVIHAAQWVRDHSQESEKVLSNSLYGAFHADREPTYIGSHPNIPVEAVADALKTHRFIVLDTRDHDFNEEWLSHIEDTHEPVTIPDMPPSRKPVLVYVAKEARTNSPHQ